MGSSKQDHFAVIARQVEQLRESIQVLERPSGQMLEATAKLCEQLASP